MRYFLLISLFISSSAFARPRTEWDKALVKIANKEGVPALLLAAICWIESSHKPHVTNHDDGGSSSIGLCQIKYGTAKDMGYRGTVEGLYDGSTNARYAAKYIKYQLDRYGGDWDSAAAAYNAGTVKQCDPEKLYFIKTAVNSKGVSYKKKVPCVIGEHVNQQYVDRMRASILE